MARTFTLPCDISGHLHTGLSCAPTLMVRTALVRSATSRVNALAASGGSGVQSGGVVKSEGAHTATPLDVRVIEHDDRACTEFQVCAFEVAGGRRQHFLSGCHEPVSDTMRTRREL